MDRFSKQNLEQTDLHDISQVSVRVGEIAHDFNNLLTGVLGNITLARMQLSNAPEVMAHLEKAEKEIMRGNELTSGLFAIARANRPKTEE